LTRAARASSGVSDEVEAVVNRKERKERKEQHPYFLIKLKRDFAFLCVLCALCG
jgi:hypothetical protein